MYHLPEHQQLKTNLLARSFISTSATYKFYWFLALLNEVQDGNVCINKHTLFANMIANA